MTKLDNTKVYRGGETSRYVSEEDTWVSIEQFGRGVQLTFSIRSKGGGKTVLQIVIGDNDFESVVKFMLRNSPSKTVQMLASLLPQQIENLQNQVDRVRSETIDNVILSSMNSPYDEFLERNPEVATEFLQAHAQFIQKLTSMRNK